MAAAARAPTPSHTREFTREGTLTKQGHAVKNWRQRHFVLDRSGTLSYFESSSSKKAKGRHNVVGGAVYVWDASPVASDALRVGDATWSIIPDGSDDDRVSVEKRAPTASESSAASRALSSLRDGFYLGVTSPSEGDVMILRADSASVRDDWAAALVAASWRGGQCVAGRVLVRTRGAFGKSWLPRVAVLAGATLTVFDEQPFPIDAATTASFLTAKRPKVLATFSTLASGGAFIVNTKEGVDAAAAAAGVTLPTSTSTTAAGAEAEEVEVGSSSPPLSRSGSVSRPDDAPVAALSIVGGSGRSGTLASLAAVAKAVIEVRDCARSPGGHSHVIIVAPGDGSPVLTFAVVTDAAAVAWTKALRASVRADPPPRRASIAAPSLLAPTVTAPVAASDGAVLPAVVAAPVAEEVHVVAVSAAPLQVASTEEDATDAQLEQQVKQQAADEAEAARAEAEKAAQVEAARQAALAAAAALLEAERLRLAAAAQVDPVPQGVKYAVPPPPPNKPSRPPSRRITGEDAAALAVPPAVPQPEPAPAPVPIPAPAEPEPVPETITAPATIMSSAWSCPADGAERAAMRKRIFEYLLRRTPASTNAAQAEYLQQDVVPSVEAALYNDAAGDRDAYLDVSTLKPRLKRVFEQRAGVVSNGGAADAPSAFEVVAAPSPIHEARPAPAPAPVQPPHVPPETYHGLDTSSDSIVAELPPLALTTATDDGIPATDRSSRRSDSKRVVFVDGEAPPQPPLSARTSLNGSPAAPVVGILKGGATSRSSSRNSSLVPAAAVAEANAAVAAAEESVASAPVASLPVVERLPLLLPSR